MVGGGMLLFVISFKPALLALRDRNARGWLLLGAVGVFIYPLAFYSSMDFAGVAVGNVVSLGTGPVFAALLERTIERHRLSLLWKITTPIALLGVLLLSLGGSHPGEGGKDSVIIGVILGLFAGFSYALYTYCSTRVIHAGHGSGAAMGSMFGVGAIGLLPVLLIFGAPLLQSATTVGIASYLIVGPMFVVHFVRHRAAHHPELDGDNDRAARTRSCHVARSDCCGGTVCAGLLGRSCPHICCGICAEYGSSSPQNTGLALVSVHGIPR